MARIHHLALRTSDVDKLVAFYAAWLGLEVVRDQRPRSVWLSLEREAVLMVERAEPTEPAIGEGTRELCAFAVTLREREALRARLLEASLLEAETEHTLYFRDPDGRRVAVSSYPL